MKRFSLLFPFACLFVFAVASSVNAEETKPNSTPTSQSVATNTVQLDVFKSPTCGCCGAWVEHVEERGFTTTITHPADLAQVKKDLGIAPEFQSCHTGVSKDGFVFEGHIPAKLVAQFLASPPNDAIGLAVPGMPMGSPGMEMGDRFSAYDVLLLKKDGSSEVYAKVETAKEQY